MTCSKCGREAQEPFKWCERCRELKRQKMQRYREKYPEENKARKRREYARRMGATLAERNAREMERLADRKAVLEKLLGEVCDKMQKLSQ